MTDSWTLLRLNPASQTRFLDLAPHDIPLYFPVYQKIIRPAKKRTPIEVTRPVYPGYIFAQIDPDTGDVHRLTGLPVRAYFIKLKRCTQNMPPTISTIPDSIIQEFKRLERLNLLVREVTRINPFSQGARIIVHLPVADIEGIIIHLQGQTRALVDCRLGHMTVPVARLALAS